MSLQIIIGRKHPKQPQTAQYEAHERPDQPETKYSLKQISDPRCDNEFQNGQSGLLHTTTSTTTHAQTLETLRPMSRAI